MNCRSVVCLTLFAFILSATFVNAQTVVQSSGTVTITATVNAPGATTSSPPGGGGGSESSPTSSNDHSATVNFTGDAYPLSNVTLLMNGQLAVRTIAGPDAHFSMSVSNISSGNYTFSLFAEDKKLNKSTPFSVPISVTAGATTNITGIFLAPTITTDKSEVKQGDFVTIFGQTTPQSPVEIHIHSDAEISQRIQSDKDGAYLYQLDTTGLELGSHAVDSQAVRRNVLSDKSQPVTFIVSNQNKAREQITLIGDVNNDGRVNLIDFSIEAFWYKKSNPPALMDFNHDGVVNIIDFSIMAYHWTG